jgi:arginine-tRNA-protein transferase
MEVQGDENHNEDSNDVLIDDDDEEDDDDDDDDEFESDDDDSGPDSFGQTSVEIENGNVGDILIGLKGSRLRYKVCNLILCMI